MPEIIPNYHPILAHFTIALLSISVVFYVLRLLLPINHRWREQWLNMANWSLWTGCLFAIATVIAGWFAYNSVAHDTPSHAAMTLHRNWAIPTAVLFLLIGFSSIRLAIGKKLPGFKFISVSIVAAIMLMVTGWLGAEAVYRYGLGVMSLPKVEAGADGHNHSHGSEPSADSNSDGHNDSHEMTAPEMIEKPMGEAMQPAEEHGSHAHDEMEDLPVQTTPSDGHNHAH
ncbi:MAG: DUF2231 domain-containing protein [Methylophaga sp.]|nr:DUF2231 domain-containing protein [Methylophaga sp.]